MGGMAVVGITWPLIETMNPSADVLALSSTEVDLSSIEEGQTIVVKWRGRPVFIRYRTAEEIAAAAGGSRSTTCPIRSRMPSGRRSAVADRPRGVHSPRLRAARLQAWRPQG